MSKVPMPDDQARLIRRAKGGDPAAFAEIYQAHYEAVYTYLFYRLGDPLLAEDLAGEVFVRLVERISKFTYRGQPILAWLYTIARNLLADHYRQHSRDADLALEPEYEPEREPELQAAPHDPARLVERRLEQECLKRALRRLADSYQHVILLRFVQGLSHAETAAILGKSENTTKVLQHRALKALRRAIADEGCYEP
jgi:RNA polymerase sigma-70 factor (ECF subfamily)